MRDFARACRLFCRTASRFRIIYSYRSFLGYMCNFPNYIFHVDGLTPWGVKSRPVETNLFWLNWNFSKFCQCDPGPVLLLRCDVVASLLTNDSTAFKCKLCCHWLIGLRQRPIAKVIRDRWWKMRLWSVHHCIELWHQVIN